MTLAEAIVAFSEWVWDLPLVALLTGGGLFFLILTRFLPFRHLNLSLQILAGRHDKEGDPGQISHYQALSVSLAATVGLGSISGVAVAMAMGGPGTIFWMWVAAIVGMATNYVTCTLAVMYRGRDSLGEVQGGPMYVITEGLGRKWWPLAALFCVAAMFGCLPIFNANQLAQAIETLGLQPLGVAIGGGTTLAIGLALGALTALVIFGGLQRISHVASALVPSMVLLYFLAVAGILILNADAVPRNLALIFTDAFAANYYKGEALFGGALGGLIVLGVRRASFSNEAGIGTAALAYSAAKTSEPVHEGLVAMLSPAIDTLLVCTLTALAILVTDAWKAEGLNGVLMTAQAFSQAYPAFGAPLLLLCAVTFGVATLFSYSYFGMKCFAFLFGARRKNFYNLFYVASIVVGAISTTAVIVGFVDIMFALMAVPTMLSAILLSGRAMNETRRYFKVLRS
ncbi:alanine:cation symporter family protein [Sandaracinobacter sp. RS1-74]|uniref:alanine/glycine:cation symporter family protein n=1 Tax=Sandaracinobacteroides sayramensis TaxID=2913411 RepID=UPI001EDB0D72|nr:alanine/glycine:cation symporter family protein [Sandaracinobacteroides sayramensis]MCG2840259.1 alanine:cation symporter family protein [Sandaracinobacteroides sayramensis]